MPAGESPRYRSEGARKTALLTKIRTLAPQRGLSPQALRRQYVLQRFLAPAVRHATQPLNAQGRQRAAHPAARRPAQRGHR